MLKSCMEFGKACLIAEDIKNKNILEVGSRNINGSLRALVEKFCPASYKGVDIMLGPGVDVICDATNLLKYFGPERFDMLISTELLEHVKNWKDVIHNFKIVLKQGGVIIITTRSKNASYHGYPYDFWRYEVADLKHIFKDFIIESMGEDMQYAGVAIKARKPLLFVENDLTNIDLYSVILKRRATIVESNRYFYIFRLRVFLSRILPKYPKLLAKNMFKFFVDRRNARLFNK